MASFYIRDTFFNTFYKLDGGDGKKQRELLTERFSFLQAAGADELTNADKRACATWTPAYEQRAKTALVIRNEFDRVVPFIRKNETPEAKAFVEQYGDIRDYNGDPRVNEGVKADPTSATA